MEHQREQSRGQLDYPFRISNRPYDLSNPASKDDKRIDRYLTLPNQKHPIEEKHLAEFQTKSESEDQLWILEQVQKGSKYRIKHLKGGLYLTLTNGKTSNFQKKSNWNQYLVQLLPLIQGQGKVSQQWSFELSQNRRLKVKIRAGKEGIDHYLESAQSHRLLNGYKTAVLCRPKTYPQRSHLQNWKFSFICPKVTLPPFDLKEFLDTKCLQEEKQFIRHFKGKIYKKNSPQYKQKIYQYASSSYPAQMQPYMVAYPTDINDIKIIINMVKPNIEDKRPSKKIVARSGGHQYSGLSSGGDDTIVISLDQFNKIQVNQDGLVEVGPCIPLKEISKFLRDRGLSVPHGVCPLVNIGGHGQTGGYGHFTRTFGLLIDYIQAFDIVLADGTDKKVNRPTENNASDLQLFRGVMGGNAGSFGIVTKFYLKGIKDADHPNSYSISQIRFFDEKIFKAVLKEYQRWSKLIADNNDDSIRGLDLLFSLIQFDLEWVGIKTTVMSLVGFYSDPDGNKDYKGQLENIFNIFKNGQNWIESGINKFLARSNGKTPLSKIAESYVLKFPLVTLSGREYNLPYKKRGNVTVSALTDQFIDQLTEQTAIIVNPKQKELKLVIQMIAGGGQYKKKGNQKINNLSVTSIPLRNLTHTFSFDVFYKKGKNSESRAEQRQKVMQKTVEQQYSAPVGQKIFFWTTFGGVQNLDMRDPKVVNKYYDSKEDYEILQELKSKVDPKDIFSTLLTVKGNKKYRAVKNQIDRPFRISSKDLNQVSRFIVIDNENQLQAISATDLEAKGIKRANQTWQVEHGNYQGYFTIKSNDGLFFTAVKDESINQYVVKLAPFKCGYSRNQHWSFDFGQDLRFVIQTEPIIGTKLCVTSQQVNFKQGPKTLLVCRQRIKEEQKGKTHQFWKLSPFPKQKPVKTVSSNQFFSIPFFGSDSKGLQKLRYRGKIFTKKDSDYWQRIKQYASQYTDKPPHDMQPYMLAYPQDAQDVADMVKQFKEKQKGKKIVARSGGHQYSGLSSGGDQTIVISMDKLNTIKMGNNGFIQIEPCVALKDGSDFFKSQKLSIPHGECPKVNIGGHGQTGGYGHFIRSFGLCIDYIQKFDIVLADGTSKTVNRPTEANKDDLLLFRGVLGGNAGSFGIVTKYYFRGIKDDDHPQAYQVSRVRKFSKSVLTVVMKEYQRWTKYIAEGTDDQMINGLNLQVSIIKLPIKQTVIILVQGLYTSDKQIPYNDQFKDFINQFTKNQDWFDDGLNLFLKCKSGKDNLSNIAQGYVRSYPFMTWSGRQFDLPYNKRCNPTSGALTDNFITQFVDQCDYIVQSSYDYHDINLVVQMTAAGGQYRQKGKIQFDGLTVTSIPLRNITFVLVYDIFYRPDAASKAKADKCQQKMGQTMDRQYHGAIQKKFFWGSFGDVDMTKPEVINTYYDSPDQYKKLQQLKKSVDNDELFSTIMTVKTPLS